MVNALLATVNANFLEDQPVSRVNQAVRVNVVNVVRQEISVKTALLEVPANRVIKALR